VARADALRQQPLAVTVTVTVTVTVMDRHAAIASCADGSLLTLEDRCPHRRCRQCGYAHSPRASMTD